MTHPPRFLRTILAQPRDDSPRLRMPNGSTAAATRWESSFACNAIRQARRKKYCPAYRERRAQQLLADFHGCWTGALSHRVSWCSFRRGFVEEIAITDRQLIKHAAELFGRARCSTSISSATADALMSYPSCRICPIPFSSISPPRRSATTASPAWPIPRSSSMRTA